MRDARAGGVAMNRRRFLGWAAALAAAWALGRKGLALAPRPRVSRDILARIRRKTRPLDPRRIQGPHDLAG